MLNLNVPASLLAEDIHSYDDAANDRKTTFHRDGRTFLKHLARALGLPAGSFDLRNNRAGVAVSGEVTLHSDTLYVQLFESGFSRGVTALYRRCQGRRDFCGEMNHFASMQTLAADPHALAAFVDTLRQLGGLTPAVVRLAA
jgi:hypothetical protein